MAYSNRVEMTDGTAEIFTRRERPHLVFSAHNGTQIEALANGVIQASAAGTGGDRSFTLVQPVNK
jgi:hypothetical protein